jgi:TetR/AcrR family transcriptional regulator
MPSTFNRLKRDKQQRIIAVALEEFSQKGFELASTNEIVRKAQIAKGMLFHYFSNKKELFLFLCNYCFEILKTELVIDTNERDIFEKYREFARMKRELNHKHPFVLDFIKTMSNTRSEEMKEELKTRIMDFRAINNRRYFENIDVSKFKKGIDVKDAFLIIKLAMEGYERELQGQLEGKSVAQIDHDYDRYLVEFDAFIKVLKNCFYK